MSEQALVVVVASLVVAEGLVPGIVEALPVGVAAVSADLVEDNREQLRLQLLQDLQQRQVVVHTEDYAVAAELDSFLVVVVVVVRLGLRSDSSFVDPFVPVQLDHHQDHQIP